MSASPTNTTQAPTFRNRLDRFFEISARGSNWTTELRGGVLTFVTMAYIVILNPLILGGTPDVTGHSLQGTQLAAVTALSAGVMTVLFGLVARLPFAFAAGLGINSFLAVNVVKILTWQEAMGLVVINGVIIVILAATGLRRLIFNAVPPQLKTAITVGIGLFIAFIGFVDSGFVRSTNMSSPPVQLGEAGSIATVPTVVFLIALVIMAVLMARKVKGALLIGIVAATIIAIIAEAVFHVGPSLGKNPAGWNLTVPQLPTSLVALPDLSLVGQFDVVGSFGRIGALAAIMLIFTLVFTNFFDAMGSMTGLARSAGLAKEDGTFPRLQPALIVEGVGAIVGGGTSASSNTVFVESASGIGEGAKTGFASVITGALFLLAMFFTPLTQVVPLEVAAAALVIVGALMVVQIRHIDFSEFSSVLPVFLTIIVMPLTYSIANGIGVGFISWVLIRSLAGTAREISPLLWIVAAGFLVYFARGPIEAILPH